MINFTKTRIIDVIDAAENAADVFGGEETYESFMQVYDESNLAATVWLKGQLLGVFTITKPLDDGSSSLAAIMTNLIQKHPIDGIKALRHIGDIAFAFHGVKQLNFLIKEDFPRAEKYAKAVGFDRKGKNVEKNGIVYRSYWRV